jgi:hypothetical protein
MSNEVEESEQVESVQALAQVREQAEADREMAQAREQEGWGAVEP